MARRQLRRKLNEPVTGEFLEELRWLAIEDQHVAEEGLVEMRSGEEVWHKHVDETSPGKSLRPGSRPRVRGRPGPWNG